MEYCFRSSDKGGKCTLYIHCLLVLLVYSNHFSLQNKHLAINRIMHNMGNQKTVQGSSYFHQIINVLYVRSEHKSTLILQLHAVMEWPCDQNNLWEPVTCRDGVAMLSE